MRPLEGITVVALEQVIAGPFATRQLAELGARVIKIERPEGGDAARNYDKTVKGLSSHFVWTNRSKESLTLDVKQAQAQDVLAKLIEGADVLVQNLAPGARFCRNTSAFPISRASTSFAASCLTSSVRLSFERLVQTKCDERPFTVRS